MSAIRLAHFYLGVFFAPLVIFFAFTGTLQVFKLHESYRDVPGSQGDWIAWFGQFHKEQAWVPPRVAPQKPAAPAVPAAPKKSPQSQPQKWFVAAMGAALASTSLLGLYIAFNYPRRRRGFFIALAAGVALPFALMAF